jgi:GT2 family glycosyltransferase
MEIIVVDDDSDDGTPEAVMRAFPAVRMVRQPEQVGFARCANRGLRISNGRVLLLLNSDTEVEDGALAHLLNAFARDENLGVAGAELVNPDSSPQWSAGRFPSPTWLFFQSSGLGTLAARIPGYRRDLRPGARGEAVEWVCGAAMAFRRAVWVELDELDEDFRFYGQDLDYCLRAKEAGWRVALVPGFRVVHVGGATIARKELALGGSGNAAATAAVDCLASSSFGNGRGTGGYVPALLWTDLLYWGIKHRGKRWQRRASLAIRVGASFRVCTRRLARPLIRGARRPQWEAETRAYARGLSAIKSVR